MRRVRWFEASWPMSLRKLAARMRGEPFGAESTAGFLLDRVRDDEIVGRYVEKVVFLERVRSPLGDEIDLERLLYRETQFNISTVFPQLELWDAPRSTQGFASKLMEMGGFSVVLAPLRVDLLAWVDALESELSSVVTVQVLQASGIELEEGVVCRISASGDRDVRAALLKVGKNRGFWPERVTATAITRGRVAAIHLAHTGSVRLDESLVEELLPAVRRSLPLPKQ